MISGLFSAPRLKKIYKWLSSVYRAMKVLPLREFIRRVYLYLGRVCLHLRGSIYPINIPGIEIRPDLDVLVMELPHR